MIISVTFINLKKPGLKFVFPATKRHYTLSMISFLVTVVYTSLIKLEKKKKKLHTHTR